MYITTAKLTEIGADTLLIKKLFHSLPCSEAEENRCKIASHATNNSKNRYRNILAQDDTRVVLSKSIQNVFGYINANHISFPSVETTYIATQAPLETTEFDFFQMIWETKATLLVALANPVEQFRVKGIPYWTPVGVTRQINIYPTDAQPYASQLSVMCQEQDVNGHIITRTLMLSSSDADDGDSHLLTQIHYTEWPDFGVPAVEELVAIVKETWKYPASPIITHCSAGVGRTGVFIAVDSVIQQIKALSLTDEVAEGDVVYETVVMMRRQRSGMVQTPEQLMSVYQAVRTLLKD